MFVWYIFNLEVTDQTKDEIESLRLSSLLLSISDGTLHRHDVPIGALPEPQGFSHV